MEDSAGQLWLGHTSGLLRWDPKASQLVLAGGSDFIQAKGLGAFQIRE
ncbi:MAG: hypothetical protein IPL96_17870 [Holophagaceae bacterium]|nr:hypothetical protein [Holophagaceae bacterium]